MNNNPTYTIMDFVAPSNDHCGHIEKWYDLKDGDVIKHPFRDGLVIYGPCTVKLLQKMDGTREVHLCKEYTFEVEIDDNP